MRKYEDSIYFAPIIGYTGKVQEDQLSALNEQWHQSDEAVGLPEDAPDKYDLNDNGPYRNREIPWAGASGRKGLLQDVCGQHGASP